MLKIKFLKLKYKRFGTYFMWYNDWYVFRNLEYFSCTMNLEKLRNVITTYVWENLDEGYMQVTSSELTIFNFCEHSCPFKRKSFFFVH